MIKIKDKLESSNFNEYPHYVYATAFLLDDKLMDYRIGDRERCWQDRTFRGLNWERYVWENFDKLDLHCKYNKILVNNNKEHNEAFEALERWISSNFKSSVIKLNRK